MKRSAIVTPSLSGRLARAILSRSRGAAAWATVVLLAACSGDASRPSRPTDVMLRLVEVASGLSSPVDLTSPDGDPRLFVVEQAGRIRVIRDGVVAETPFLDIRDRVRAGGERGLLGLAFHPRYVENGRFFVDYTDAAGTVVERYRVSGDPDLADPASAFPVLRVAQPFANHNGGQVAFGPDGMLYAGLGDGGGAGDPLDQGQDVETLLGSILRIDVDSAEPYAIPPDNPFAAGGGRPEIWAYGLRNPWRFSFDTPTGRLYIGDVGQDRREEIDVAGAGDGGLNFGWPTTEGTLCFRPADCDPVGLQLPVLDYDHDEGCSVTGGFVYRGTAIPELDGHYLYSDFCAGWVRSFRLEGAGPLDETDWGVGAPGSVTSFGRDSFGELYILTAQGGVLRIERAG